MGPPAQTNWDFSRRAGGAASPQHSCPQVGQLDSPPGPLVLAGHPTQRVIALAYAFHSQLEMQGRGCHRRVVPRILVIDDHAPMRRSVVKLLQLENFEVVAAENGRLGLEAARAALPDLVLCDIIMPGVDGYAVLQALREAPETATVPFIFLTACEGKFDQRRGMNLGADDYLTKPVEHEDLLAAICARLARKRAHDKRTQAQLATIEVKADFSSSAPLERLGLTAREAEVLLWAAQGKSNASIALILDMAEKTLKTHLGSVFAKLGVESRTAATLRALELLSVPVARLPAVGARSLDPATASK